jgi:hypothetical protein
MRKGSQGLILVVLGMTLVPSARASVIYNNLTPTNQIAMASRPDSGGGFEIESADDFTLGSHSSIFSAAFTGLVVPGAQGLLFPWKVLRFPSRPALR